MERLNYGEHLFSKQGVVESTCTSNKHALQFYTGLSPPLTTNFIPFKALNVTITTVWLEILKYILGGRRGLLLTHTVKTHFPPTDHMRNQQPSRQRAHSGRADKKNKKKGPSFLQTMRQQGLFQILFICKHLQGQEASTNQQSLRRNRLSLLNRTD